MQRQRIGTRAPAQRPSEFELALPCTHAAIAYVQERLQRQGAQLADPSEMVNRPADDPIIGDVAIAHPDERMGVTKGKVLGLFSQRPGMMPTLILAPGMDYAERLKEQIDELHHYGQTKFDRDAVGAERPNVKEHHVDALDQYRAYLAGRTIHGPRPKARHLEH